MSGLLCHRVLVVLLIGALVIVTPLSAQTIVRHLPYGPDPQFEGDPNQPNITWCLGWSSWNGRSKPTLMGWGETSNGTAAAVFDKAELQAAIDDAVATYGSWNAQILVTQVNWITTPIPMQFVPVVGSANVGSGSGYFGYQDDGANGHALLQDPKINSPHRGAYGAIPANPQWLDHTGTGQGTFAAAVTAGVPSGASALSIAPSWTQFLWSDILPSWTLVIEATDVVQHYVDHPDALLLFASAVGDIGVTVFGANQWGGAADIRVQIINAEPVIVALSPSQWVGLGEPVSLSVVASGAEPLYYQWWHGGVEIPGATEPTLLIPAATEGDAGTYQVCVTNAHGEALSDPTVHLDVYRDFPPIVYPELSLVPEAWLGEVRWNGDIGPVNKIEDAIDNAPSGTHQIVVAFNVHVGPEQLAFLSSLGEVEYVCRFISAVAVADVTYDEIVEIANRADVALIERQISFAPNLDISLQSIQVISGYYSPNTIEDQFPLINGGGVNIAIMDTGVDDPGGPGITHAGFPTAVASYNALADSFENPDDADGHGTHVASIALGRGVGAVTRGVAPAAGLIDVKVLPGTPEERARETDEGWEWATRGLETLIENRWAWNVRVINMSFGADGPVASEPVRTFNLLLDYAVALGITVVVSGGNEDLEGFFPPADADRALTVAASNDSNTPDRSDDTRATFFQWWGSQWGPRADDGDADFIDELKPVVAAPGAQIYGALYDTTSDGVDEWGTSMAAPHVAGLAALILQSDSRIQPLSIVQKLTSTAERRGAPSDLRDPYWNDEWGWGLVDAYAALGGTLMTDLTFPNDGIGYPWASPDIWTDTPPRAGEANRVYVQIQNRGPYPAEGVQVRFGVRRYLAANLTVLDDLGTLVLQTVPVGVYSPPLSVAWTPMRNHECLYVEIGYALDTVQYNNRAQRNVTVAGSPVSFGVQNYLIGEPIQIDLVPTFETPGSEWQVQMVPSVVLGPGETTDVALLPIPPTSAPDGATETIHVAAMYGDILLGGVSVIATKHDCNGNTIDDYLDIQGGTSVDCDDNGVPDECQPDTDGDDWIDPCDNCPSVPNPDQTDGDDDGYGDACDGPGDVDHDGDIDASDFGLFLAAFGYSEGDLQYNPEADYDGDGTITFADYQIWLQYYRANTGPQAEPPSAAGTVTVRFDPASSEVGVGETVSVNILADTSDPLVGWGLDLTFDGAIVGLVGDPNLGSAWWSAHASDVDGLVGLAFPDSVSGSGVVLASLELEGLAPGQTSLDLSTTPDDLTEGMPLDPNGFDTLLVEAAQVTVVPVLESSDPPADGTLPKIASNVIRLTFNAPIALPDDPNAPALSVVPLAGGSDLGDQFLYSVEPDGVTLKAAEDADVLTDLTWYQVTPTAGFAVKEFTLDLCTLRGDANNSGRMTTADYSEVKAHMGEYTDARYDLNGSGRITTADYIVVKDHMGNRTPDKPALCP